MFARTVAVYLGYVVFHNAGSVISKYRCSINHTYKTSIVNLFRHLIHVPHIYFAYRYIVMIYCVMSSCFQLMVCRLCSDKSAPEPVMISSIESRKQTSMKCESHCNKFHRQKSTRYKCFKTVFCKMAATNLSLSVLNIQQQVCSDAYRAATATPNDWAPCSAHTNKVIKCMVDKVLLLATGKTNSLEAVGAPEGRDVSEQSMLTNLASNYKSWFAAFGYCELPH